MRRPATIRCVSRRTPIAPRPRRRRPLSARTTCPTCTTSSNNTIHSIHNSSNSSNWLPRASWSAMRPPLRPTRCSTRPPRRRPRPPRRHSNISSIVAVLSRTVQRPLSQQTICKRPTQPLPDSPLPIPLS